jgi:hypothetical protein
MSVLHCWEVPQWPLLPDNSRGSMTAIINLTGKVVSLMDKDLYANLDFCSRDEKWSSLGERRWSPLCDLPSSSQFGFLALNERSTDKNVHFPLNLSLRSWKWEWSHNNKHRPGPHSHTGGNHSIAWKMHRLKWNPHGTDFPGACCQIQHGAILRRLQDLLPAQPADRGPKHQNKQGVYFFCEVFLGEGW